MTKTLQKKIDLIYIDHLKTNELYCHHFDDINNALQEFREQIKKLHRIHYLLSQHEYVDLKDVLALIGENK